MTIAVISGISRRGSIIIIVIIMLFNTPPDNRSMVRYYFEYVIVKRAPQEPRAKRRIDAQGTSRKEYGMVPYS